MTLKELREKRAAVAKEHKTLTDSIIKDGRRPTDDEDKRAKQLDADYADLSEQLKLAERSAQMEAEQATPVESPTPRAATQPGRGAVQPEPNEPAAAPEKRKPEKLTAEQREEYRTMALDSWIRYHGPEAIEPDDDHLHAIRSIGFNLRRPYIDIPMHRSDVFRKAQAAYRDGPQHLAEQRTLSALVGASGGALVPDTLVNQLEVALLAFGGVMQVATVLTTSSGEVMTIPTMDDTANSGAQLGEGAAVTSLDPSFGGDQWSAYKFTSKYIDVPYELLQDAAGFDLANILGTALGTRIGRILNTKFTTGSGAGTPKGVVTCSTLGATSASATAITWAELNDLIHAVDPAYRSGSRWMAHDTVFKAIENLTDAALGRPLWMPDPNSGVPGLLRTYPWTINQDMQSSVAASTKTMLFGRLDRYRVRMVGPTRLYRLTELHRLNDLDCFLAFQRADGNYLSSGTTASLVHLLQHA